MGSFFGHALPGTFFYVFGLWYALNTFYYHIKYNGSQNNHAKKAIMTHSFRFCCQKKHIPIEGIIKFTCCVIGMCVEGYGFFLGYVSMYQHFTMYAFFGFTGLIDIFLFYDFAVPMKFDYLMLALSYFTEGMLFAFHVHNHTPLDVLVHVLLVYVCYFSAINVVFVMIFEKKIIFKVFNSLALLVQGSWFWQVGAILYPIIGSKWCETCHANVMKATVMFCWHIFCNLILILIVYLIMAKSVKPADVSACNRYEQLETEKDFDVEDQREHLLTKEKEIDSFL